MQSFNHKLLGWSIGAVFLFAFVGLIPHASKAAGDEINLSQAQIVGGSPSDVSSWSQTATITGLTLTGDNGVRIDFDKLSGAGAWPNQCNIPGFECGPNSNGIQYTEWMFRNVGGTWFGSGFIQAVGDYNNPASTLQNTPCDWFYYVPEMNPGQSLQPGEQVAFMVTAGSERRGTQTSVRERSNVALLTVPNNIPPPSCAGGGSSGGGSGGGSSGGGTTGAGDTTDVSMIGINAPGSDGTGVNVFAGANPTLAFDPYTKLWLIAGEQNGSITGQLMTEQNKPSGSVISIGAGVTPKVAFGKDSQQFLVAWVDGQAISGRFFDGAGASKGNTFRIGFGGNPTLHGNSSIVYDNANKRFIVIWSQDITHPNVLMTTVSNSGSVGTASLLAGSVGPNDNGNGASIAVDTKTNQYCASYLSGNDLVLRPIDAGNLNLSPVSTVANASAAANVGIVYNDKSGAYLVSWQDSSPTILSKNLSTCADDESIDPTTIASGFQSGSIIYNSTSGASAIVAQSAGNPAQNSLFILSDASGAPQNLFGGGSNNIAPAIGADSTTGGFGAASSQDGTQVKFIANAGVSAAATGNSGPIPAAKTPVIPSSGLPTDIAQLIEAVFNWALSIIGLVIFVRFFYAGFLYFTAAGSTDKTGRAKNIMWNAAYGAVVLFSAYVILYTINPNLVQSTFGTKGLPAVGDNSSVNSSLGSCGITSGDNSYLYDVQNAEQAAFNDNAGLAAGQLSTQRDNFLNAVVQELIYVGRSAGRVKDCSGNVTPDKIMVGYKDSEKTGQICTVLTTGPTQGGTVQESATASCDEQGPWTLMQ